MGKPKPKIFKLIWWLRVWRHAKTRWFIIGYEDKEMAISAAREMAKRGVRVVVKEYQAVIWPPSYHL